MYMKETYSFLDFNRGRNREKTGELLSTPSKVDNELANNVIDYHDNGSLDNIIDRLHKRVVHVSVPEGVQVSIKEEKLTHKVNVTPRPYGN